MTFRFSKELAKLIFLFQVLLRWGDWASAVFNNRGAILKKAP